MNNSRIEDLIPHRGSMLLIERILELQATRSSAEVCIGQDSTFFEIDKGVPAWIGLEYMGQTAALMAGYQVSTGNMQASLGFLLGTRRYKAYVEYFKAGTILQIECEQAAIVGESLATFDCRINNNNQVLAEARLSVLRKQLP